MDNPIDCRKCCVYFGKKTEYTQNTPINERVCYIEGVGQLFKDCYENIYSRENFEIKFVEG